MRLAGLEDFRESTRYSEINYYLHFKQLSCKFCGETNLLNILLIHCSAIADLTSMALGRSLVGGVHTNDNDGVSLVLWDTSGQNEDININETLLQKSKGYTMLEDEAKSIHSSMPSLEQSPDSQSSLINLNAKTIEKSPPMDNPLQHNDISSTSELAGSGPARNMVSVTQAKVEPASDIRELMRMDLSSFKPLTRAVLPDAEDFFDVTITLAGSPSNFTVSFTPSILQYTSFNNSNCEDSNRRRKISIRSSLIMRESP